LRLTQDPKNLWRQSLPGLCVWLHITLMRLIGGQLSISDLVSLGLDSIAGSHLDLASFLSVIEKDDRYYDLVPMPTG
jgi:hypothetical protein